MDDMSHSSHSLIAIVWLDSLNNGLRLADFRFARVGPFLLHQFLRLIGTPLELILHGLLIRDDGALIPAPTRLVAGKLPLHERLERAFLLLAQLLKGARLGYLAVVGDADDRVGPLDRRKPVRDTDRRVVAFEERRQR